MKKRCVICKRPKKNAEFNKAHQRADGLQPHCRTCNQKRSRAYYRRNRKHHRRVVTAIKKRRIAENKLRVLDYLRTHPCVDCGEADTDMLEFDHVRGVKRGNVSHLVLGGCSWQTIQTEIAKCDVRCANHHRKRTRQVLHESSRHRHCSSPSV